MPIFKYAALTADGKRIEGTRSAAKKEEILEILRLGNQYPIFVDEVVEHQRNLEHLEFFNKVNARDIALFCRQFYTLLRAGVVILNCLEILRHQTEKKRFRGIIAEIHEQVQKGMTLSEAMASHGNVFPELLVNMVAVGEVSGTLDIVMERMSVHFEKENKITNKVKNAMVYPALLATVAAAVVIFLLVAVMPTFVDMFTSSGVKLPLPTRILLAASNLLVNYGLIVLIVTIACIYGFKKYLNSDAGKFWRDSTLMKLPVIKGVSQKIYTSRFTRTLSTLIASGIPLIRSLEVVSRVVGNTLVERSIRGAVEDIKRGVNLSVPIRDSGLFPPMVHYMLSIGEESGSLDDLMDRTANYFDDEVENALTRMIAMLEPLMILVMAVVVGGIAVSMVMPMFDMLQTV